jgi:hypothetical protein
MQTNKMVEKFLENRFLINISTQKKLCVERKNFAKWSDSKILQSGAAWRCFEDCYILGV